MRAGMPQGFQLFWTKMAGTAHQLPRRIENPNRLPPMCLVKVVMVKVVVMAMVIVKLVLVMVMVVIVLVVIVMVKVVMVSVGIYACYMMF